MASSSNCPPDLDVAVKTYLDQKLQAQGAKIDALGDQIQQLTAATLNPPHGFPPAAPPPPPPSPVHPQHGFPRDQPHFYPRDNQIGYDGFPPRPAHPRQQHGGNFQRHGRFPAQPPPVHLAPRRPPNQPVPFARDTNPYEADPPLYGTEEFDEDVDDGFLPYQPPVDGGHRDVNNRHWESRFKLEILEFHGTHNVDEFLDWLTFIEHVFYSVGVPSHACVNLAAGKFKGGALA